MSYVYERLPDPGAGLRLHLNENTAGCSERVLEAMRAVTRTDAAFYPDYTRVHGAVAAYFGVGPDRLLLTNGLDEGIHAACFAWLQRGDRGEQREAVIVEPAFDMYAACADAAGGRVRHVTPRPEFEFPLEETLAAITGDTRLVFLTSPNNPTGLPVPRPALEAILTTPRRTRWCSWTRRTRTSPTRTRSATSRNTPDCSWDARSPRRTV